MQQIIYVIKGFRRHTHTYANTMYHTTRTISCCFFSILTRGAIILSTCVVWYICLCVYGGVWLVDLISIEKRKALLKNVFGLNASFMTDIIKYKASRGKETHLCTNSKREREKEKKKVRVCDYHWMRTRALVKIKWSALH